MIRARVIWGKNPGDFLDCDFAYPLKEGDSFLFGEKDGGRLLGKVEQILHIPVNVGSGNTPSVMYSVDLESSGKKWYQSKRFWKELLGNTFDIPKIKL